MDSVTCFGVIVLLCFSVLVMNLNTRTLKHSNTQTPGGRFTFHPCFACFRVEMNRGRYNLKTFFSDFEKTFDPH